MAAGMNKFVQFQKYGVNCKPLCIDIVLQNGIQFYWHILENLQMESNKADNFEAIFCTMCLITIEMGGDDILVELIRLALDIQVHYITYGTFRTSS